jgi:hypothetical protein
VASSKLNELSGSRWAGRHELWLDALQNEAITGDCSLAIDDGVIRYGWQHEEREQRGEITLRAGGAEWHDSWHQARSVRLEEVPGAWGLFALFYTYPAGDGTDWGWRTTLALRPTGELLLQMTNVMPWGEEQRAVRMVLARSA